MSIPTEKPILFNHRGRIVQMNKNAHIEKPKVAVQASLNNSGLIAYGANTHNGLVRGYNEDRISIVLDLKKPGIPISQCPGETDPSKKI